MQRTRKIIVESENSEKFNHELALENEESSSGKKPDRVILILTYLNRKERKEGLFGTDVPDLENWEDMADKRWLKDEKSEHGPLVMIRMRDQKGRAYLRDLQY